MPSRRTTTDYVFQVSYRGDDHPCYAPDGQVLLKVRHHTEEEARRAVIASAGSSGVRVTTVRRVYRRRGREK